MRPPPLPGKAADAIRYEPVGPVPLNGLTAPITFDTVRAD